MDIVNVGGVAVFRGDGLFLTDTQSALDMIGDASYHADSNRIVVFKENIADGFFKLSSGILGDILQKFVTYGVKVAIVGDFSGFTSKPLQDFIYESNRGGHIFFVKDEQTALERLKI